MTKKKIYGAQPTREPFFRDDERVRGKYRQGPTPLAIPSSPPSTTKAANLTNRDARRAASRSRVRSQSVSSKATSNESRPHPRRHSHSRRTSRVSSPESPEGVNLQSPTSAVLPSIADVRHIAHDFPNNIPSAVAPIAGSLYASSPRSDSISEMSGQMPQSTDISLAESLWLHTSYNSPALPSLPPAHPAAISCLLQGGSDFTVTSDDFRMQPPVCPLTAADIAIPPSPAKDLTSYGSPPMNPHLPLDGNTPFIFSAEAEAQAAARLAEAGLQSSVPPSSLPGPFLPPSSNFSATASSPIRNMQGEYFSFIISQFC
jgi:hypothetical protein